LHQQRANGQKYGEPTLVQYGIFKAREFQPYIIKIKPEIGYQNGGLGQMKVLL
jgi:hypothetical protein